MIRFLIASIFPFLTVSGLLAQFGGVGAGNMRGSAELAAFPSDSMPIYLTGKVTMADGSPIPASVNIQRICGNSRATVAYTDAGGYFSFQWRDTGNPTVMQTQTDVEAGSTGFGAALTSGSRWGVAAGR